MRRSLLGVLLVAVAASGCGGGNPVKERREFLAEANKICNHFEGLQNEVVFPTGNPLAANTSHVTRAEWGLAMKQIVNYGRNEVRELRKQKAPKDLRDRYQQMVDTKAAAFELLAQGAEAAKRNHPAEIKAPVAAGRAMFATVATEARKLGLPKCA